MPTTLEIKLFNEAYENPLNYFTDGQNPIPFLDQLGPTVGLVKDQVAGWTITQKTTMMDYGIDANKVRKLNYGAGVQFQNCVLTSYTVQHAAPPTVWSLFSHDNLGSLDQLIDTLMVDLGFIRTGVVSEHSNSDLIMLPIDVDKRTTHREMNLPMKISEPGIYGLPSSFRASVTRGTDGVYFGTTKNLVNVKSVTLFFTLF